MSTSTVEVVSSTGGVRERHAGGNAPSKREALATTGNPSMRALKPLDINMLPGFASCWQLFWFGKESCCGSTGESEDAREEGRVTGWVRARYYIKAGRQRAMDG